MDDAPDDIDGPGPEADWDGDAAIIQRDICPMSLFSHALLYINFDR